jgi:hypothetical protein
MLARLKWATRDAIKQWKAFDSSIITNEMRAIFIRRARRRLIFAYRKMRQLYPANHASKLAMPRLKQLRTEDIGSMISEYKHFLTAANMLEEVPSPITEAVVASILQARPPGLKLPRAHTNNL